METCICPLGNRVYVGFFNRSSDLVMPTPDQAVAVVAQPEPSGAVRGCGESGLAP